MKTPKYSGQDENIDPPLQKLKRLRHRYPCADRRRGMKRQKLLASSIGEGHAEERKEMDVENDHSPIVVDKINGLDNEIDEKNVGDVQIVKSEGTNVENNGVASVKVREKGSEEPT